MPSGQPLGSASAMGSVIVSWLAYSSMRARQSRASALTRHAMIVGQLASYLNFSGSFGFNLQFKAAHLNLWDRLLNF